MSTNNNTSPTNGGRGLPANNAANSSKTASPNLLLKMLEACARHKRRHEHERREPPSSTEEERQREQKCLGELNQFAAFLPRIEATVNVVRESYSDEYQYNPPREADGEEESGTTKGVYPDNRDQTKHLRSEKIYLVAKVLQPTGKLEEMLKRCKILTWLEVFCHEFSSFFSFWLWIL